jgi:hypothetical protein
VESRVYVHQWEERNHPFATMPLHPLLATENDKQHITYDKQSSEVIFTVPCTQNDDGTCGGTAHLSGDHLSRIMGVPNPDLMNLTQIDFIGANTSAGFAAGGHIHFGKPGTPTASPICTSSRVHHYDAEDNSIVAAHVLIPAGNQGKNTFIAPQGGLGCVVFEKDASTEERTKTALGRELRWSDHIGAEKSDLVSSCTKVGHEAGPTRYLVPITPAADNCAMSKLLQANESNTNFCNGAYHPERRQVLKDEMNRECAVMTSADFQSTHASLHKNLTTQCPVQHGLTFQLRSIAPTDQPEASISVHCKLHREKTFETLGGEEAAASSALTRQNCHALLGEMAATTTESFGGGSVNALAQRVFQVNLDDGHAGAEVQPLVESAGGPAPPAVVEIPDGDDEFGN